MAKTVFFERGYLAGYCVKRRRVLGHLRGCKLPSPAPCFPCLPRVSALKGLDGRFGLGYVGWFYTHVGGLPPVARRARSLM